MHFKRHEVPLWAKHLPKTSTNAKWNRTMRRSLRSYPLWKLFLRSIFDPLFQIGSEQPSSYCGLPSFVRGSFNLFASIIFPIITLTLAVGVAYTHPCTLPSISVKRRISSFVPTTDLDLFQQRINDYKLKIEYTLDDDELERQSRTDLPVDILTTISTIKPMVLSKILADFINSDDWDERACLVAALIQTYSDVSLSKIYRLTQSEEYRGYLKAGMILLATFFKGILPPNTKIPDLKNEQSLDDNGTDVSIICNCTTCKSGLRVGTHNLANIGKPLFSDCGKSHDEIDPSENCETCAPHLTASLSIFERMSIWLTRPIKRNFNGCTIPHGVSKPSFKCEICFPDENQRISSSDWTDPGRLIGKVAKLFTNFDPSEHESTIAGGIGILLVIATITGGSFFLQGKPRAGKIATAVASMAAIGMWFRNKKFFDEGMKSLLHTSMRGIFSIFGKEYLTPEERSRQQAINTIIDGRKQCEEYIQKMQTNFFTFMREGLLGRIEEQRDKIERTMRTFNEAEKSQFNLKHHADRIEAIYKLCFEAINNLRTTAVGKQLPVRIYIYGRSGTGKTTFVRDLLEKVNDHYKCQTYRRKCQDEYWSGYCGQSVLFYDDLLQRKDHMDAGEWVTHAHEDASFTVGAAIEDKGKPVNPIIMVATSIHHGLPSAFSSPIISDPESFHRRRDIVIFARNSFAAEYKEKYNCNMPKSMYPQHPTKFEIHVPLPPKGDDAKQLPIRGSDGNPLEVSVDSVFEWIKQTELVNRADFRALCKKHGIFPTDDLYGPDVECNRLYAEDVRNAARGYSHITEAETSNCIVASRHPSQWLVKERNECIGMSTEIFEDIISQFPPTPCKQNFAFGLRITEYRCPHHPLVNQEDLLNFGNSLVTTYSGIAQDILRGSLSQEALNPFAQSTTTIRNQFSICLEGPPGIGKTSCYNTFDETKCDKLGDITLTLDDFERACFEVNEAYEGRGKIKFFSMNPGNVTDTFKDRLALLRRRCVVFTFEYKRKNLFSHYDYADVEGRTIKEIDQRVLIKYTIGNIMYKVVPSALPQIIGKFLSAPRVLESKISSTGVTIMPEPRKVDIALDLRGMSIEDLCRTMVTQPYSLCNKFKGVKLPQLIKFCGLALALYHDTPNDVTFPNTPDQYITFINTTDVTCNLNMVVKIILDDYKFIIHASEGNPPVAWQIGYGGEITVTDEGVEVDGATHIPIGERNILVHKIFRDIEFLASDVVPAEQEKKKAAIKIERTMTTGQKITNAILALLDLSMNAVVVGMFFHIARRNKIQRRRGRRMETEQIDVSEGQVVRTVTSKEVLGTTRDGRFEITREALEALSKEGWWDAKGNYHYGDQPKDRNNNVHDTLNYNWRTGRELESLDKLIREGWWDSSGNYHYGDQPKDRNNNLLDNLNYNWRTGRESSTEWICVGKSKYSIRYFQNEALFHHELLKAKNMVATEGVQLAYAFIDKMASYDYQGSSIPLKKKLFALAQSRKESIILLATPSSSMLEISSDLTVPEGGEPKTGSVMHRRLWMRMEQYGILVRNTIMTVANGELVFFPWTAEWEELYKSEVPEISVEEAIEMVERKVKIEIGMTSEEFVQLFVNSELTRQACVDPDAMSLYTSIQQTSVFGIYPKGDTKEPPLRGRPAVWGTGIRGKHILTVKHVAGSEFWVSRIEDGKVKWYEAKRTFNAPHHDVAILTIRDVTFPAMKNITNRFLTSDDLAKIVEYGGNALIGINKNTISPPSQMSQLIGVRLQLKQVNLDESHHEIRHSVFSNGAYGDNNVTQEGDCGSLYFRMMNSSQRKLYGIHCAGSNSIAACVLVTQSNLEDWIQSAELHKESYQEKTIRPSDGWKLNTVNDIVESYKYRDTGLDCVGTADYPVIVPDKTKLYRSGFIVPEEYDVYQPAVLSKFDPRNPGFEYMYKGLSLYAIDHPVLDVSDLKEAISFLGAECISHLRNGFKSTKVMTLTEAINGSNSAFCPVSNPINRNSSVGFPFQRKHHTTSKRDYLEFDEEKKIWVVTTKPHGGELVRAVQEILSDAGRDEPRACVFSCFGKDELVKAKKISGEKAKTRIFMSSNFQYVLAFRRYFLSAMDRIQEIFHQIPIKIGINGKGSDWDVFYHQMSKVGKYGFDTDCVDWDANINPMWQELLAEEFWNPIYKATDPHWEPQHDKIRINVHKTIEKPHVIHGRNILRLPGGQVSGQPATAPENSVIHAAAVYAIFKRLAKRAGQNFTYQIFRRIVCFGVYGDDFICTCDAAILPWFNRITFVEEARKMGFKMTDARKTEGMTPYDKLDDLTFLKRGFKRIGHLIVGPLQLESLMKGLVWTKGDSSYRVTDDLVVNGKVEWPVFDSPFLEERVKETLSELAFHGEEVYNKFYDILLPQIQARGMNIVSSYELEIQKIQV